MSRYRVHLVLLAVYSCLFWLNALDMLDNDTAPRGDGRQYLAYAYNLSHHRTFSVQEEDRAGSGIRPDAYREPGYPLLLAMGLRATPSLRELPLERLFDGEYQDRLRPLRYMQMLLLFLTSLLAMAMVRQLTHEQALGYLVLVLVGFSWPLLDLAADFYSETLITFLFTAFSLALVRIAGKMHRHSFALAGFLLAGLALTRAAFQYFWIPCLIFFYVLALWNPIHRRRLIRGAGLFLVCFFAIVWAWMARNYYQLDRFYLADRGGVILDIRAGMDMMTRREYLASFLYWSNSPFANSVLVSEIFDDSETARLDPDYEGGFVRLAKERRNELRRIHGDWAIADKALIREATGRILRHPIRHALVTVPVALRGMYVERSAAVSLLMFGLFSVALLGSCVSRNGDAMAALMPAAVSFGFHAFLTHNIPRYAMILIPILWIGAALVLDRLRPVPGPERPRISPGATPPSSR